MGKLKKLIHLVLFLIPVFGSGAVYQPNKLTNSTDTIDVADFGISPNTFENSSLKLRKAIETCRKKQDLILKLPEGRIDLWPEGSEKRELFISNDTEDDTLSKIRNIGILIEETKNLTIEGKNTLIMLHGKMISFAILNSENIGIKGIRFDYERPTMSELTIKSATRQTIETEIHPDSKYLINDGKISFYGEGWKSNSFHAILFQPDKERMKYSSFKPFLESRAVKTAPQSVTFTGDFSKSEFHRGDILTIRDPYRDNCGGFINLSRNVRLEEVKMYFMHGLGIVSQFSENLSFLKVDAAPRKISGRIIASFADCFHFSGCRGTILIDSCLTSGSHDDPVNVHGTHLKIVTKEPGNKLIVRFMHHQTYGFPPFFAGDSIEFVNPQTLLPLGFAKLRKATLVNNREMELEPDGKIPENVSTGDCIENITWTPEVIIRNSRFERTNTRGLLLTTRRKILIEHNTFYHTGMHAILIANDASEWFESGPVHDVTIRNNLFEGCGYNSAPEGYTIAINPENHELVPGKMVHRNIRIENNIFKVEDSPVLTARSVDNLRFTNNQIIFTGIQPAAGLPAAFKLTACKKVEISGNKISGIESLSVYPCLMSPKELKTDLQLFKTHEPAKNRIK